MDNKSQLLVIDGGAVKTEAEGVVTGLGIVFGSEQEPDQSSFRDFFTNDSFIQKKHSFTVPLFYEHGLGLYDDQIGEATLTKSEGGWHADANIDTTTEIGQKVYEAVKDKPHGFSTGAMQHLVKREAKDNGTNFLKKWVVGELSLTERPAERKAVVQAVKSVDGEAIYEEAFEEVKVSDLAVTIFYPDQKTVFWASSSGEPLPSMEDVKSAEEGNPDNLAGHIEIKYAGGSVTYNLYSSDEDGESMEMSVVEHNDPAKLIAHLQNILNKAALSAKKFAPPTEEDFDTRVARVVKEILGDGGSNKEVEELQKQLDDSLKELADLRIKLSESEDALTNAQERMKSLEILAGAQETINKYTGK